MSLPPTESDAPLSRKRQSTRTRLLDAAQEVFAREGVGQASVDAIAEQAGFTRGAFYSNFATKNDLLAALAIRENERRMARVRKGWDAIEGEIYPNADAPAHEEEIIRLVDGFLSLQFEDRTWLIIEQEMRLLAMRDPEFGEYYLKSQRDMLQEVLEVMETEMCRADVKFKVAPERAMGIIFSTYMEAVVLEAMGADKQSAREMLYDSVVTLLDDEAILR